MGPIGCPETSVRNYHYPLRNSAEELRLGRDPVHDPQRFLLSSPNGHISYLLTSAHRKDKTPVSTLCIGPSFFKFLFFVLSCLFVASLCWLDFLPVTSCSSSVYTRELMMLGYRLTCKPSSAELFLPSLWQIMCSFLGWWIRLLTYSAYAFRLTYSYARMHNAFTLRLTTTVHAPDK